MVARPRFLLFLPVLAGFLFLVPPGLPAREEAGGILFGISPGERMTITTRSNLRVSRDGRYLGFRYGEERVILDEDRGVSLEQRRQFPPGTFYRGSAFRLSATVRDQRLVARGLDDVLPLDVHVSYDGTYRVSSSGQALAVRSIPSFPDRPLFPGDTWEAFGEVVIDPFEDSFPTRVRVYIAYRFEGPAEYQGEEVLLVSAQYALRYRSGDDPAGDPDLLRVQGRHILQIYMSADGRNPLFIRDTLEDQFFYRDGTQLDTRGFRLTFFDTPRPRTAGILRERLRETQPGIAQAPPDTRDLPGPADASDPLPETPADRIVSADPSPPEDEAPPEDLITLEETDLGLRFTLPAIRFVANQAAILPEEGDRLQQLARALEEALNVNPQGTFLVVGHTADVGTPEGQQRLSVERAQAIVRELTRRGVADDRFLYQGRGASEPRADNETARGRALNRRVEVYLLE